MFVRVPCAGLLQENPNERMTARELLDCDWLKDYRENAMECESSDEEMSLEGL